MRSVVVIGGGCSGVLAGLHLLRTGTVSVTLVEPGSKKRVWKPFDSRRPQSEMRGRFYDRERWRAGLQTRGPA